MTQLFQQNWCENVAVPGVCGGARAVLCSTGHIGHDRVRLVLHNWHIVVACSYLNGIELWLNFCPLSWLRIGQNLDLSPVCGALEVVRIMWRDLATCMLSCGSLPGV
jgi:hypothetical protein